MSTSDPMTEETEAAPGVLVLPPSVEQERVGSDDSLGNLGRPFDRRSPFFIGLSGAFGVAVAYVLFRGVSDVSSVLVIIGVALFIAIGLNPIIVILVNRGLSRGAAAAVVTAGFILVIAAFHRHRHPTDFARGAKPGVELSPLQARTDLGPGVGWPVVREAPSH